MFKFISGNSNIDFMGKRKLAAIFSLSLILASIGSLFYQGLNFGIDFTGGYLIEVGYKNNVELEPIRNILAENSYKDVQVQHFGTAKDIMIRIAPRENINKASLSDNIISVLKKNSDGEASIRRVEFVGPQVGEELRDEGGLALLVALFGILVYISFRFQLKSATGAILSLVHDVIIVVGIFSMTQMEFDLTVLAAILAVIGYSLNDTVVVLDRIRETFRTIRKTPPIEILNMSINQTLSRTLMTSFTTMLVLFALFFLGGEVIHAFAFALLIGIGIGTYSSIYIASTMLVVMNITKQDFLVESKSEVVDDRP